MAEPTDQPAPPTGVTKSASAAQDVRFAPELPRGSDALPIYRPLSLLALAGFCLAVLYTVVIVIGVITTFLSTKPWLQDLWMMLFPLVVAGLCALGLIHVKRSEGTVAGAALGRWGLWLTAIVGLGYWSYYATIRYTVTSDADRFGRTFLEKLSRGETHSAFLNALEANQRPPEDAHLRENLEMRANAPGRDGKGLLSQFEQMELVRLLRLYGPGATIESRGASDFRHDGGRYWVTLNYHVSGPQGGFDVVLLAQSAEGQKKGRGWRIEPRQCTVPREGREFTPEAERMTRLSHDEHLYQQMKNWFSAMKEDRLDEAFLATKLLPERRELQKEFGCRRLLSALAIDGTTTGSGVPAASVAVQAALASNNDASRDLFLPGFRGFLDGDLVHVDDKVFWAPPEDRETIIQVVKRDFRYPSRREELVRGLTPESVFVRLGRTEGDRFLFEDDFTLHTAAPQFVIQGYLVFDCDAKEAAAGTVSDWRLRSIELYRGRTPTPPQAVGRGGAEGQ